MGNSFGPYSQAVIKGAIVTALLYVLGKPREWEKIHWHRDRYWLIGYLFTGLLSSAPIYYATNKLGIGLSTVIFYASIMLSMFFFGWLFTDEMYTRMKCVATCIALLGLYLIFRPAAHSFSIFPIIAAIVSGFVAGLNINISRNIRYNSAQSAFLAWSTGVIVNIPIVLIFHEKIPASLFDIHWLYLLIFAVASLLSSWAVITGVKRIDAGLAGLLGILEIIFGFAFGIIFFHERPAAMAYVGAICVIAAAAIPYIDNAGLKEERKA